MDFLCDLSVIVSVCEHLNGWNAEHKFRVWVTLIVDLTFTALSYNGQTWPVNTREQADYTSQ